MLAIIDGIILILDLLERAEATKRLKDEELEKYIAVRNELRKARVEFAKSLGGAERQE
jgi:hypothetical protein